MDGPCDDESDEISTDDEDQPQDDVEHEEPTLEEDVPEEQYHAQTQDNTTQEAADQHDNDRLSSSAGPQRRRNTKARKSRFATQSIDSGYGADDDQEGAIEPSSSEDWEPGDKRKRQKAKKAKKPAFRSQPETREQSSDESSERSVDSGIVRLPRMNTKMYRNKTVPNGFVRRYYRRLSPNQPPYYLVPINVAKIEKLTGRGTERQEKRLAPLVKKYRARQAEVERLQKIPGTKEHRRLMKALPELEETVREYEDQKQWERESSEQRSVEYWACVERERREQEEAQRQRQIEQRVSEEEDEHSSEPFDGTRAQDPASKLAGPDSPEDLDEQLNLEQEGPHHDDATSIEACERQHRELIEAGEDIAMQDRQRRQSELYMEETNRRLKAKYDEEYRRAHIPSWSAAETTLTYLHEASHGRPSQSPEGFSSRVSDHDNGRRLQDEYDEESRRAHSPASAAGWREAVALNWDSDGRLVRRRREPDSTGSDDEDEQEDDLRAPEISGSSTSDDGDEDDIELPESTEESTKDSMEERIRQARERLGVAVRAAAAREGINLDEEPSAQDEDEPGDSSNLAARHRHEMRAGRYRIQRAIEDGRSRHSRH